MNKNLLQKLTIVIFSYNRHRLLKRSAKYWSNYNVKIVILDGSSIKLDDPCLKSKNIKYIHDPRTLYERLLSSPNYIDTEFMILACDDEFYLPSALSTCVEILSKSITNKKLGNFEIINLSHDKKIYVKDLIKQIFKVNKLKNWRIRIKNKTPGDSFGAITSNKYLKKKFINHKFVSLEEGLKRYFIWIYKVNKKNFYKSHPYKIDKNYIL